MAAETFVSRATSSSGSPRNTRHYGHLALNGKTLRPICIDARGGAFASFGRALRRPFGLSGLLPQSFEYESGPNASRRACRYSAVGDGVDENGFRGEACARSECSLAM